MLVSSRALATVALRDRWKGTFDRASDLDFFRSVVGIHDFDPTTTDVLSAVGECERDGEVLTTGQGNRGDGTFTGTTTETSRVGVSEAVD